MGGGVTNYRGDLSTGLDPAFSRGAGHFFIRHNLNEAVSFKYGLMLGKVAADDQESEDDYAQVRNLDFATRLVELSAQFEYNFLDYRSPSRRRAWSPYLLMGVGYLRMDPVFNQLPDYPVQQLVLPFGLGIKHVIQGQWNMGIEFGARKTFTDYLDDLGGEAVSYKFGNGNPNTRDLYAYTCLTVSYTFYKVPCPRFY